MECKKILIIGAGTVGKAVGTLIEEGGHTVSYQDLGRLIEPQTYDIIHIAFPMVDIVEWAEKVNWWLDDYPCTYLIIESSIVPSALDHLDHPRVIYSPIRATEAIMPQQLKTNTKFWASLGQLTRESWLELKTYFTSIYPQGHQEFECAESLAFGKMLEVVDFGLQIMFAQQVKLACDAHGWDFDEAYTKYRRGSQYGYDYISDMSSDGAPDQWVPRAIFRPGVIGGKCVMQDAKLLEDANLLESMMLMLRIENRIFKRENSS